jgi:L-seryl-tRNA(Ser) seleniumtransferase
MRSRGAPHRTRSLEAVTARDPRRSLPQVDALVRELQSEADGLPHPVLVDAVRTVVDAARKRARRTGAVPAHDDLVATARAELVSRRRRLLRPVINATGVILHTNLGRAPLSERAIEAVTQVARGYSNLEWDIEQGRRGDRFVHVEPLLALASGAEAALVVNNNAAAVLLVCAALGAGKEVIVSRGELIEIGGEFRIPDVLTQSGARLREVGTTNRTRASDYEKAIGDETAFLLKVHPSNYRVVGFVAAPSTTELADVAHKHKVPLVFDVGSGLLAHELADEPLVSKALIDGADLVCFSGDKLLGGPQAGVVVGGAGLIAPLRKHPLLRALRPDKMQLAALGATVTAYLEGSTGEIPVLQMLDAPVAGITRRAKRLVRRLRAAGYGADTLAGESVTGGGSLPGEGIPTTLVKTTHPSLAAKDIAARLRCGEPPVLTRVESDAVLVDLRTVLKGQETALYQAFLSLT